MTYRCLVSSTAGALLLVTAAVGQYTPPQLVLSHPGSQAGFTDDPTVQVTVTYPRNPHADTLWCITQDSTLRYCQSNSVWTSRPTHFTLTGRDGLNKVFLEYKYGGTVSGPGEADITLDQRPPSIALTAPAGLPGAVADGAQQMIDMRSQFITGAVFDAVPTDPVTLSLSVCNAANSCTYVNTIPNAVPPFVWPWPVDSVLSDTTYIQIQATNGAGKSSSTTIPNPPTVFSVFAPASLISPITCSAATCPVVAFPNDPPSPSAGGSTFSGYADPSMRRDPAVSTTNPNGTKLWMLYSHPEVQTNTTFNTASQMVEIHLASSVDSGATWQVWCAQPSCGQETPIWPSFHWPPQAGQAEQYSSHEVANFWPYSSDDVNWKWYAVHLMYFVQPPMSVSWGITTNGCLVTTVATTPAGLGDGWTGIAGSPPISCTAALPTGSHAISYTDLDTAAGSHLPSGPSCFWGEPAIMVQSGTAYLAAQCYDKENFYGYGYFVFTSTVAAGGGLPGPWSYFAGPFSAPNVKQLTPKAQFVTEMDWAQRSDGSLVAVVSPASIANHVETQYGCVALDFTLTTGFGSALVAMNDQDPLETQGPNACTYEPASNTGVLIARRLISSANSTTWSLIASGLMP